MNIATYTINGRIPSKKNSRNIFIRKGRPVNIPSSKYKEWHDSAAVQLKQQGIKHLENVQEIQMEFFMPDNIKTDLTNKAESVMDLLVDLNIIKDDSWQEVKCVLLDCRGIDKKNPRVLIWRRGGGDGLQNTIQVRDVEK